MLKGTKNDFEKSLEALRRIQELVPPKGEG